MVGRLADLVEVDHGWGTAFESAAGAALAAAVVDGPEALRSALTRLHDRGAAGALLPLLDAWRPPGPGTEAHGLPPAAHPVRSHVRTSVPAVGDILDRLLAGAVAVSSREDAVDLALARPDLVVVTHQGDRLSSSGWHVGRSGEGGPAAALEARREATSEAYQAGSAAAAADAARRAADSTALAAAGARRELERASRTVARPWRPRGNRRPTGWPPSNRRSPHRVVCVTRWESVCSTKTAPWRSSSAISRGSRRRPPPPPSSWRRPPPPAATSTTGGPS